MRRTVWLASYPKSGNTWFRIFLANLLYPERRPLDLNELPLRAPIASSRLHFDEVLGVPSALLTPEEIGRLRPDVDDALNGSWEEPLLLRKAHDAYTWLPDGRPLMGRAPTFSAIYLVREPWDVTVSAANHYSCSLEEAVQQVIDPQFTIARSHLRLRSQLAQRLLSWEGHALSWLSAHMPLHVMRYEAMKQDPLPTFRAAVRFLGFAHDDQAIESALEACRIERLQRLELEARFRETPLRTQRFFRSGKTGEGLERLTSEQLRPLLRMSRRVARAIESQELAAR